MLLRDGGYQSVRCNGDFVYNLVCREAGIPLIDVCQVDEIDLTIDGADEVSPGKCLIKGGGAVSAIESKYTITPTQMVKLKEIKTKNNPIHNG